MDTLKNQLVALSACLLIGSLILVGCDSGVFPSGVDDDYGLGPASGSPEGSPDSTTSGSAGRDGLGSPFAPSDSGDWGDAAATGDGSPGTKSGSGSSDGGEGGGTQAGQLTAGSFDDNLNLEVFRTFISDLQQTRAAGIPSVSLGQRVVITVTNEAGNRVGGATVIVTAAQAAPQDPALVTLTTGTDGRSIFVTGVDAAGAGDINEFAVTVQPPGEASPLTITKDLTNLDWTIVVAGQDATTPPAQLELAFVIDCTGSMGDELEYLKAEVSSIVSTVASRFPSVAIRFGLVVYRDEGDEYVTRSFDFTDSLQDFQTNLSLQSSNGGGDYEEAVHKALLASRQLSWTTGSAARVLFWIADAPPHGGDAQNAFENVLSLRNIGVRLYPLAASGVASEAEFLMRTAALLTGAEYLFLTDDSGIGNSHAEPHIPCYLVQRLDQVLIRVMTSELAGHRIYPNPDEVVRTVGNPVNGVCAATQPADQQ